MIEFRRMVSVISVKHTTAPLNSALHSRPQAGYRPTDGPTSMGCVEYCRDVELSHCVRRSNCSQKSNVQRIRGTRKERSITLNNRNIRVYTTTSNDNVLDKLAGVLIGMLSVQTWLIMVPVSLTDRKAVSGQFLCLRYLRQLPRASSPASFVLEDR